MAQGVEKKLTELYLSNADLIEEGFTAEFNRGRHRFVEALRLGGVLPGRKDERYHLTDIRELYSREWEYYFTPSAQISASRVYGGELGPGAHDIVLCNGFSDGRLHYSPEGVAYGSLRVAASDAEMGKIVASNYTPAVLNGDSAVEPLSGLNGVFVPDGAFVYVPDGVQALQPVVIDCRYFSHSEDISCFARSLVVLGSGASAEVVLLNRSGEGAGLLANSVLEVVAGRGAKLKLSEFSYMHSRATLLHGCFIKQSEDSIVETVCAALGGQTTRAAHTIDLEGGGAEAKFNGIYLAGGEERMDFYLSVNHFAADCRSDESVKGIASGNAVGSFTGRVYVAPDAQRTQALQQSRNIELGEGARIYTRPQLEIYADDVKCSHGATVGQLDHEAVYYMRQRGIDLKTARRMQLEGFVHDVMSHYGFGRDIFTGLVGDVLESL